MKIKLLSYERKTNWKTGFVTPGFRSEMVQLVLVFGELSLVSDPKLFNTLREQFLNAFIVISSAAGEIIGPDVLEEGVVVTAIQFEKTTVRCHSVNAFEGNNSFELGKSLMQELYAENINAVFVVAGGPFVNGSELVSGFNENNIVNGKIIPVTGGIAGGSPVLRKTCVGLNEIPVQGNVVAIGFYGDSLRIGHGIHGGADEFGPERLITRADKNILYEIDGKNALDFYKEYLGPYKDELPGTALLFPLSVQKPNTSQKLVRTVLKVNEEDKSLLFAGSVPEGSVVRLMKANTEKLIRGSLIAAERARESLANKNPDLIMVVSCMGRKLVMHQRTDEEVEAIQKVFTGPLPVIGFYSFGEISPFLPDTPCEFHNQTMTITTFDETV